MIKAFECSRNGRRWNDVVVLDTDTNDFTTFCYEIVNSKLVKFSEHTSKNDAQAWIKERSKALKYEEVSNDFLDFYELWNPETDLTEDIIRKYQLYRYEPITATRG
ncbi:hypothetical protein [Paenibacillus sp. ISL-20]|uniref:hypothetical protein n=1 Tax=Paenibacillus sp. ISL-20 TaxID=2819163 RepID=UPI001BE63465|nr:hypothetical protein [Paenibacillus sp. ISL-20]MBT2759887.1 hypothetical protein [Paenibacillus sp. ISL-20]